MLLPTVSNCLLRDSEEIVRAMGEARRLQIDWSQQSVVERAKVAQELSHRLVDWAPRLVDAINIPQRRNARESISAEILPLAAAAKWLGKNATKVLQPRTLSSWRSPLWLSGVRAEEVRDPFGMVMIIAAWNYPLLLMGSHSLQALVAGNAVAIKTAPGCESVTQLWIDLLVECGVPRGLIIGLDPQRESLDHALKSTIDLVVMTGSSEGGRKVLEKIAPHGIPAVMELGGADACFVLASADLDRAARAMRFSLEMNSSATCMASRRIFVDRKVYTAFQQRLANHLQSMPQPYVDPRTTAQLRPIIDQALIEGAKRFGEESAMANAPWPMVLENVKESMAIYRHDAFAPLLMLIPFDQIDQALTMDRQSPYGLSAAIFGNEVEAKNLASKLDVGFVCINDVIVPTADPRVAFGGRKASGFGMTRGAEGLRSMTQLKTVSIRRGTWLPHLDKETPSDTKLLWGMLSALHGKTWKAKWHGVRTMISAIRSRRSEQRSTIEDKKNDKE
ncbi:MAG: aldehyde dehydrogenase family protein [Pirellulales bacterium]